LTSRPEAGWRAPARPRQRGSPGVAGLAASLCCLPLATEAPNEELLGKSRGYFMGTRAR